MKGKLQSDRLTTQQKETDGVIGIFNDDAKIMITKFIILQHKQRNDWKQSFLN